MDIYYPEHMVKGQKYPVVIFFFGGGWKTGRKGKFRPHAKHFSKKGLISVLADYRVESRHKTSPFESLKDAKSAIRFLRLNAEKFHIDPDKIIASGGSAGGHLAAATATIEKYNDSKDDLNISAKPNALVLFNPVIDNGPGGYGFKRIGSEYHDFSPLHNIQKGAPPTIIFLGTKDHLIPVETVRYYKKVMERVGSRCDLYLYEGQPHGFFNYKHTEYYNKTVEKADEFLSSLGYIKS
ncbi:alpha/beta hydrolase [Sinomicrobium sp. FJxs]|uniref:Alpha/beta hydrolase n=2 Tax=Sinomicrobium weinanense TaxID=2842200 RepID=A0A926JQ49_9FLAO|nr:alpha/beta hydrolase [Sinomicrobium weinanense]MBU3121978.1 alpha/beta hydrolase [Sinomicrobium weinanense]